MNSTPSDGHNVALRKVGELIHDVRTAMLTTIADDGSLRSRPMGAQNRDFTGEIWFFTADDSGKVDEIYHHREVGLTYVNPSKNTYISLSGVASVVRDRAKAEELWSPLVKAWFPKGIDDPHLILLRVNVHSAEYWDGPSSRMVSLYRMAKAAITGNPPKAKAGEHGTVTLGR